MIRLYNIGLLLVRHEDKNVRSQRMPPVLSWDFPCFAARELSGLSCRVWDPLESYLSMT